MPHNDLLDKSYKKLESAQYLLAGGYYEDTVSRAYYSMYYGARALLELKDIYPKTHSGIISKFGLEFVKDGFIDECRVERSHRQRTCGKVRITVQESKSQKKKPKMFSRRQRHF